MNIEDFRKYGKEMIDFICEYKDNVKDYNVTTNVPAGCLKHLLPDRSPQQHEHFENIFEDFKKQVLPGMVQWNNTYTFGNLSSGNSYPSILGEMLSSAIGSIGFSWASCPAATELETIVLDWYAKALGLPEAFLSDSSKSCCDGGGGGGALQGSSFECILVSMLAARNRVIKKLKDKVDSTIHDSIFLPELVAYTSRNAHFSVLEAAKMALVKLRIIDTDNYGRMRVDLLKQTIENDINAGLTPFFVVATIGTRIFCDFDDLTEIGMVCQSIHNIWFHVDGTYAGNSFILPEMRTFSQGLEYADSFNTNPNKLLLVDVDASTMWVRDVMSLKTALNVDPLYLQHEHDKAIDYRHYGIPLSRRFRALKLWFVFRTYGLNGLRKHVRQHILLAKKFEKLLLADKRFHICNKVQLGIVCFSLNANETLIRDFLMKLNKKGKIRLDFAVLNGKHVIQFCIGHEHIHEDQVVRAWAEIRALADNIFYNQRLQMSVIPSKVVATRYHQVVNKATLYTQFIIAMILCAAQPTPNITQGSI